MVPEPKAHPTELQDAQWVLEKTHAIKFGAALALIPPALLLVFGLFAGWVVSGFRA